MLTEMLISPLSENMRDIISQMQYGHTENTSEVNSWQRHRLQSAKSLDLLSLFEQS